MTRPTPTAAPEPAAASPQDRTPPAQAARAPQDFAATAPLLRRLLRDWVWPHWPLALANFAAIIVYAATDGAYALIIKFAIEALEEGDPTFLTWGPMVIVAVALVKGTALYSQKILTNRLLTRVQADLQIAMYHKMIDADLAWLSREAPAALATRLNADVALIKQALERLINGLIRDSFRVIALFIAMLYIDWQLTLIALAVFPIVVLPLAEIGRRLRQISRRTQQEMGATAASVQESLAGVRMAKTYRIEAYLKATTADAFEGLRRLALKAAHQKARIDPLMEVLGGIAVAGVVAFVGFRTATDANTLGDVAGFISALLLAAQPIRSLGNLNAVVQEGLAGATRAYAVLDEPTQVVDAPGAAPLRLSDGAIRFDQVTFRYGEGAPALSAFSLDIPGGARVALVGRSGAGKSTVFNLAPRLYDVSDGAVRIDGQDLRAVTLASLRDAIALVGQDAVLFNDTVRANIAFGRRDATDAEIEQAARAAAAHDFIMALPGGYDAPVGERGENLSGGQRQRLSIARAFLRDAPILLLDEATSALDAESEAAIKTALDRLSADRTTLIIAHRLSTILDADKIVVMDQGRVVETGRHAELLAADGLYASLYRLQFAGGDVHADINADGG